MKTACTALLVLVSCIHTASASEGDRSPAFRSCVNLCTSTGCAQSVQNTYKCKHAFACKEATRPDMPLALRVTRWGCQDDCRYLCMADIEHRRRLAGKPPIKYFGKWPFQRILGAQEAASVLFSLANLCAHLYGLSYLLNKFSLLNGSSTSPPSHRSAGSKGDQQASSVSPTQPPSSTGTASGSKVGIKAGGATVNQSCTPYPYIWLWRAYALLHMNAWVWSSVFHVRDTPLTERLDYCSAIAVVAAGAVTAFVRTLGLQSWKAASLPGLVMAAGLAAHLRYMLLVKFDYDWNVKVCACAGILGGVAWAVWALTSARKQRHPGRLYLLAFLLAVNAALLLEVLDFPPLLGPKDPDHADMGLGLVDAHAIWHAATVPLTLLFYHFLVKDVAWWYGKKHDD